MNGRPRIEGLRRDHQIDLFDCGQEALNRFIRYAFQNQQAEASQTCVALMGDEVVGFYTFVVAPVEADHAPQRLGRGLDQLDRRTRGSFHRQSIVLAGRTEGFKTRG